MDKANSLLRETAETFYSLISKPRKSCESILSYILQLPIDIVYLILGFNISVPTEKIDLILKFFFKYLEDNAMYFDEEELYADENIEVVDIFQSMDVKFQRFLTILEQVKDMDILEGNVSE